nr:hypothetical protein [Cytophagales bacterium]
MKPLLTLLALILATSLANANEKIDIAATKSVELNYAAFAAYDVYLINDSGKPLKVAVIDPKTGKQVQGFGLGPIAKVLVSVEKDHVLTLTNTSLKEVSVTLQFIEKKPDTYNIEKAPIINFTLHNPSLKSIPLIIPNVMNPNLSPMSTSGVALKIGQKIFYRKGNEEYLILMVDESIRQGDKIDVANLIKNLKK